MKLKRLFTALGVLCLAFGQFCPMGTPATMSELAFEEMLPEDTVLYISVPDATALVTNFKNSNAYRIISAINPAGLLGSEPRFQRARELYATFVEPLTEIFQKRIAVAIKNIPPSPGIPGMILLADVDGKEEQLRQYLEQRIHPVLTKAEVPMLAFKHGEYDVRQFSLAKPLPFAACYAIADGVFMATVGRGTIEEMLDRPKPDKSLADSVFYQEVRRRVGEKSDLLVYANISAVLERLGGAIPPEPGAVLRVLGLTDLKAAGLSLDTEGPGSKQTLFVYTGPQRKGILNLLAREAPPLKVVEYVPEDVTLVGSVYLGDFAQFWDEVMGTVREAVQYARGGREWERIVAGIRRWESKSGFRIKEDILSPFGGELGIAVKVPEVMGLPPVFLLIEVKDAEKVESLFRKLVGAVERAGGHVVRTEQQYKGVTITSFSLLPHGKGAEIAAIGFVRPACAMVGDFLVVGIHSRLVRKIVDVHQGGESLRDNPQFKRVMANLSERGSMTSYLNMRELYDFLYGTLGGVAAARMGPDFVGKLGKIAPYFGSSASRISCDDKGITWETFSESGGAEQLLQLAVVGTVTPAVIAAKAKAQEAMCLNNLRQLAVACMMHAEDHGKVLPSKLSELYPDYVDGLGIFVCPVHQGKQVSESRIDAEADYKLEIPGAKLDEIKEPGRTVMISEKEPNHRGGRNAAYADGHVERVRGAGGVSE